MKNKLTAIVLILCLLFSLAACNKGTGIDITDTDITDTNPVNTEEKEDIPLSELDYVYGEITDKIFPDILVLKLDTPIMIDEWGETVHIITDSIDDWCVKDQIEVHFSEADKPDYANNYTRIIAHEIHPLELSAKPIIYFYPKVPTVCSTQIHIDGRLTCTYPIYTSNGWQNFTAHPDGKLIFPNGKEYYALYWEGIQNADWDFSEGYCVRGEDTASFLEWALSEQGLTEREANEFIIYWLPLMQDNPYNVISFQKKAYTDSVLLDINPMPDSMLRVFMTYYPTDTEINIKPQAFDSFKRQGFTVVEWGGSEVKKS